MIRPQSANHSYVQPVYNQNSTPEARQRIWKRKVERVVNKRKRDKGSSEESDDEYNPGGDKSTSEEEEELADKKQGKKRKTGRARGEWGEPEENGESQRRMERAREFIQENEIEKGREGKTTALAGF